VEQAEQVCLEHEKCDETVVTARRIERTYTRAQVDYSAIGGNHLADLWSREQEFVWGQTRDQLIGAQSKAVGAVIAGVVVPVALGLTATASPATLLVVADLMGDAAGVARFIVNGERPIAIVAEHVSSVQRLLPQGIELVVK